MDGSPTFTTVTSRTIMSIPTQSTTSAAQRERSVESLRVAAGGGRVGQGRSSGGGGGGLRRHGPQLLKVGLLLGPRHPPKLIAARAHPRQGAGVAGRPLRLAGAPAMAQEA